MIYSFTSDAEHYYSLGERVKKALEVMSICCDKNMQDGPIEIEGTEIFGNIASYTTKDAGNIRFENHRKYMDIQCILKGEERIFFENTKNLKLVQEYDKKADIEFYIGAAGSIALPAKTFILLYPGEAHAPAIAVSEPSVVQKLVIKVLV